MVDLKAAVELNKVEYFPDRRLLDFFIVLSKFYLGIYKPYFVFKKGR